MAHGNRKDAPGGPAGPVADYRKRVDLLELELGVYRDLGDLVFNRAPSRRVFERVLEFALSAFSSDSGVFYVMGSEGAAAPASPLIARGSVTPSTALATRAAGSEGAVLSGDSRRLAVALTPGGRAVSVVEAASTGEPFTPEDARVLSSLATHISTVLERGDLFTELDHRVSELSTLYDVGSILVSSLDQETVRHRAMEAITRLMRAEAGSLLLVDDETGELYFEVALGEKGSEIKEVRLRPGEGIAGWVAEEGEPVVINDVNSDKRFQGRVDRRSKFTTRNMLCVPVCVRGRVIGVLQAINKTDVGDEGDFTDKDLRLFELFSNQVAIALDNARLYEEIRDTFHATSAALAEAIEKRDPYTGGHTRRVLAYCMAIAGRLGLDEEEMEVLRLSAVLHDIGKIGVEDGILRKQAPLNAEEAESMKLHPQYGAEILKHVPRLKEIVPGMLHHHERVDGLGYPMGLRGEEIPLIARIISVADTFDAMTTTRPYRDGLPSQVAFDELRRFSGEQFDRDAVEAFLEAFENGEITNLAVEDGAAGEARTGS